MGIVVIIVVSIVVRIVDRISQYRVSMLISSYYTYCLLTSLTTSMYCISGAYGIEL